MNLKKIEFGAIYSSSSLRAFRTAEIITGNQKGKIVTSDQLREMSFGEWEVQTEEEIQTYDADRYEAFWKAPHLYNPNKDESFADVQTRVIEKVNEVIHNHLGTNILIVTHMVVIKMLRAYYEGRALSDLCPPPYIHPTCLCKG